MGAAFPAAKVIEAKGAPGNDLEAEDAFGVFTGFDRVDVAEGSKVALEGEGGGGTGNAVDEDHDRAGGVHGDVGGRSAGRRWFGGGDRCGGGVGRRGGSGLDGRCRRGSDGIEEAGNAGVAIHRGDSRFGRGGRQGVEPGGIEVAAGRGAGVVQGGRFGELEHGGGDGFGRDYERKDVGRRTIGCGGGGGGRRGREVEEGGDRVGASVIGGTVGGEGGRFCLNGGGGGDVSADVGTGVGGKVGEGVGDAADEAGGVLLEGIEVFEDGVEGGVAAGAVGGDALIGFGLGALGLLAGKGDLLDGAFAHVHRLSQELARAGDVFLDQTIERLVEGEAFPGAGELVRQAAADLAGGAGGGEATTAVVGAAGLVVHRRRLLYGVVPVRLQAPGRRAAADVSAFARKVRLRSD